jgi:hypothetical protein
MAQIYLGKWEFMIILVQETQRKVKSRTYENTIALQDTCVLTYLRGIPTIVLVLVFEDIYPAVIQEISSL